MHRLHITWSLIERSAPEMITRFFLQELLKCSSFWQSSSTKFWSETSENIKNVLDLSKNWRKLTWSITSTEHLWLSNYVIIIVIWGESFGWLLENSNNHCAIHHSCPMVQWSRALSKGPTMWSTAKKPIWTNPTIPRLIRT